MKFETESIGKRKNVTFRCGVIDKPYMRRDNCSREAVFYATEEAWHKYNNYRIRYGKYHEGKDIPILQTKLICERHKNYIESLPEDPKELRRLFA